MRRHAGRGPRNTRGEPSSPRGWAALIAAALLAGCGGLAGTTTGSRHLPVVRSRSQQSATSSPSTSTTEAPLPVTPVDWTPCGDDLQCGSVTVPLNYADPQGPTISVAVERHPAEIPADRIGSLVFNPGGPGVSGIDDLPSELSVLTPGLLDDFDIVTFDPRGVGRSDPVTCGPQGAPSSNTTPLPDPVPTTLSAQQALLQNDEAYASVCEHDSGSILPYVGTVDAAQDLDRIRAAIGDPQLTFMGYSYGTLLGATYAQMFPTHVRAMVLDGAIDPALSGDQMVLDQAESFEQELDNFFSWCEGSPSCPWSISGDPTSELLDLINRSRSSRIPAADGRSAGPGEIYDAVLSGLYSQGQWPTLAGALAEAEAGNGSGVLEMSDGYRQDGSSNGADAAEAIYCLDHPVSRDTSSYPSLAAQDAFAAPVFGPMLSWGLLGCAVWPVLPTRTPAPASAPGSPPILVTGTTMDPATPYQWAVDLAHELSKGVLLTWQGENHVAYYYSSCVRQIDQAYLISLTLPAPGTVCSY